MIDYNRQILALNDVELEKLVREWVNKQTNHTPRELLFCCSKRG